nr:MAG TPA: hypothetical protein [Caudoviricetes sp.]
MKKRFLSLMVSANTLTFLTSVLEQVIVALLLTE